MIIDLQQLLKLNDMEFRISDILSNVLFASMSEEKRNEIMCSGRFDMQIIVNGEQLNLQQGINKILEMNEKFKK